jgi:hypothetical protein
MANDDTEARLRMNRLAEREAEAPDWLRRVLRLLAEEPAAFRPVEPEPPPEASPFIYFH